MFASRSALLRVADTSKVVVAVRDASVAKKGGGGKAGTGKAKKIFDVETVSRVARFLSVQCTKMGKNNK
jgi:hypothetical protein